MKVLVTCPPMLGLFHEFRPAFEAKGVIGVAANVTQVMTQDELVGLLPDYDGWIIGDDPATRRVFEAGKAGRLKAAVKWGVGVDNVDFAACKDLGIPITNTPGMFGREVADVAITYVLGLARETFRIDREIRLNNAWPKPAGVSTWNKTAAVVGCGDIGQQIVRRLLACDMRVIVYDPVFKASEGMNVEQADWPSKVEEADFLIFACPLTPNTRAMFNRSLLPRLKPGIRVINVSRGQIIDEAALLEGLRTEIVHSAALDVFDVEPLPAESGLRAFDRCIFGSHNGSNTVDAVRRVSLLAIDRIAEFLSHA